MKVCVYAISKNEAKFVDRWVESMKEADAIYVLDTGSTDDTVEKLKVRNVHVEEKIVHPWRFDEARNLSLEMVPLDTDICVCTDLDEVFEKGWREKLEKAWSSDVTRARYNYNWSFDSYGNPAVNFYIDKIHSRKNYVWVHPVHEVLKNMGNYENTITIDSLTLNHYPDFTKSRGSYLPLLEISVKEDPQDDRNMHYLGREYMYYGRWNESIDILHQHLKLESATWKDERCASMRFIARDYIHLKRYEEANLWFQKAIEEAPYLRDPFVEYALFLYEQKAYEDAIIYLKKALLISKNEKTYINEPFCYDGTVEDILSICLFYTGNKEEAYEYAKRAQTLKPNDERIQKNVQQIKESL